MGQPWDSLVTAEGVTGKNLRKILYRRLTQGQDIVENALLAHETRSPNQVDSKTVIVYPEKMKGELTEPISNFGPTFPDQFPLRELMSGQRIRCLLVNSCLPSNHLEAGDF